MRFHETRRLVHVATTRDCLVRGGTAGFEATDTLCGYEPEGRGFESLQACHEKPCGCSGFSFFFGFLASAISLDIQHKIQRIST